MFDAMEASVTAEAKEKIDFENIIFPIYRQTKDRGELFRIESVTKLLSLRMGKVVGIGLTDSLPEDVFVRMYSFWDECQKEQFDHAHRSIMDQIPNPAE